MGYMTKEWVKANSFNPLNFMVRPAGFEPAAYGFEVWLPVASNFLKFL